TDETRLLKSLTENHIRSIFIFGKRDRMYPPKIGRHFLPKLKQAEVVLLDADHEMINEQFISTLASLLI
ncbi:MAG: alpha/beta hydrolase, partial [Mucilaginibacter sp.]